MMIISFVVSVGVFYYTLQFLPGVAEALSYFFGLLAASYAVDPFLPQEKKQPKK